MGLIALVPAIMFFIAVIVVIIRLRKTKHPEKVARIFAVIAVIAGVIYLICAFIPYDYKGPGGIDYIGQAIVWALMVNALLYTALGIYISFAIAATVYAIKAMKIKEKRKSGVISLIMSWVLGLVFFCMIISNVASDQAHMRNINVKVTDVIQTTSSEGPAVVVTIEFTNNTKKEINYLGSVYDETTQGDKELGHASIEWIKTYNESDIEMVKPGETKIIKKGYKLKNTSEPVKFHFSNYGGSIVYEDYTYVPHAEES